MLQAFGNNFLLQVQEERGEREQEGKVVHDLGHEVVMDEVWRSEILYVKSPYWNLHCRALLRSLLPLTATRRTCCAVRWSPLGLADIFHLTAFFDLPKTVRDAKSSGWVEAVDTGVTSDVTTYCMEDDPRVCMLYDANGVAAGIDVSVLVADVDNLAVDFHADNQELFVKMERFGIPIYRTRVYWVPESVVKEGRSTWKNGLGSGLWFEGKNGRVEIPIEKSKIESETLYTEQACIPTMGVHYYYNMTENADCSKFHPYFLLVGKDSGKVHGVGFQTFGKSSKKNRDWFEDILTAAIKPTVPHSPDCLPEWVDKVGVISLHVYFRDNELTIWC